jgi:enoyl-CoA hydratase
MGDERPQEGRRSSAGAGAESTPESHVLVERQGSVLWVTFNRPEARNAMTFAMYERLAELAEEVNRDRSVRVMVLKGAGGKAFIAGTDISQFRDFTKPEHATAYEERMDRIIGCLETVRVPVIAAIQGPAVGGGAGIASACDLRIGSPTAKFGFPIARTLGNCLSMRHYARMVSLVGVARTKQLIFTARLIDAQEMLACGLLNEITEDEDSLLPHVEQLAQTIAGFAPLTLEVTKEALRRIQLQMAPDDGSDLVVRAYMSRDLQEGIEAFFAKRKPRWKGE